MKEQWLVVGIAVFTLCVVMVITGNIVASALAGSAAFMVVKDESQA